jgi:hypothetical protein
MDGVRTPPADAGVLAADLLLPQEAITRGAFYWHGKRSFDVLRRPTGCSRAQDRTQAPRSLPSGGGVPEHLSERRAGPGAGTRPRGDCSGPTGNAAVRFSLVALMASPGATCHA